MKCIWVVVGLVVVLGCFFEESMGTLLIDMVVFEDMLVLEDLVMLDIVMVLDIAVLDIMLFLELLFFYLGGDCLVIYFMLVDYDEIVFILLFIFFYGFIGLGVG